MNETVDEKINDQNNDPNFGRMIRLWKFWGNKWCHTVFTFPNDPSNLTTRANAYHIRELSYLPFWDGDHPSTHEPAKIHEELLSMPNPLTPGVLIDPDLAFQQIKKQVDEQRKMFADSGKFFSDQYNRIQQEKQQKLKTGALQKVAVVSGNAKIVRENSSIGKLLKLLAQEQGATIKDIRSTLGIPTYQEGDLYQQVSMFGYTYVKSGDKFFLNEKPSFR